MEYYIICGWIAIISLISIIVTIADKLCAIGKKRRVPEATLLALSALGGSFAMLVTMLTIRHKTKHPKFMVGIPVIMVLQIAVLCALAKFVFFLF